MSQIKDYAEAGDYWGDLKISEMTGKLEGTPGTTSDCLLNPGCEKVCAWLKTLPEEEAEKYICSHCYAMRYLAFRDNVRFCYARNTAILSRPMTEEELPSYKPGEYIRFESFGDLMNLDHLDNLCRIARKNPECRFLLMTKRHEIVYAYVKVCGYELPENLVLVGSSYMINDLYNADLPEDVDEAIQEQTLGYNCGLTIQDAFYWLIATAIYRHTFTVWDTADHPECPGINCGGKKCRECRACWSHSYSDRHELLK